MNKNPLVDPKNILPTEEDIAQEIDHLKKPLDVFKTEDKKLPKLLIVSAIGLVLMLVIGAVGYYYYMNRPQSVTSNNSSSSTPSTSPEPAETDLATTYTWQTYQNDQEGFSIDYRSDWSWREFPDTKDGAAFNPMAMPGYPDNTDSVTASVGQKVGSSELPFAEYIKTAATSEIQDYEKLASSSEVTTNSGATGYLTTWMVQPFLGRGSGLTESLPIAYFEIPGDNSMLLRVTLNRAEDKDIYQEMLKTVKITPRQKKIVDEKAVLENVMKKYIALKHNSDESALKITVSKIEGNYAQGGVSDEFSGGMWFAAKEDGVWMLVWDGNGVMDCASFSLYPDFPTTLVPECYDMDKQDMVKR